MRVSVFAGLETKVSAKLFKLSLIELLSVNIFAIKLLENPFDDSSV